MFGFLLFLRAPSKDAGDGAGSASTSGEGEGETTTGAESPEQKPAPQKTESTQAQPFAVFPDADALNERLARAQKSGQVTLLQELGFEDADGLKAVIQAHKEREDADKSETEKLQGKLDTVTKSAKEVKAERDQALAQLKAEREARVVERLAQSLGFTDVTDATSLVDRAVFEYSDEGQLEEASVKTALEAMLEAKPHLGRQNGPAPRIDAQAGTGAGPAQSVAKNYNHHLPGRLRSRLQQGGTQSQ